MKKFDRVTATLIYLQTRSVVTAQQLAERFDVSERTVYRDIRTLEAAGVPVGSEAGVGYFLARDYRLPPVMFTRDEAAALAMGAKLIDGRVDGDTQQGYGSAMDKIRAVLRVPDRDFLSAIDDSIAVRPSMSIDDTHEHDRWLIECRAALARSQVMAIDYSRRGLEPSRPRVVEPIGLYFYGHHWHLIGWCREREAKRDFRLDRVQRVQLLPEQFARREHGSLQDYLSSLDSELELHDIELRFSLEAARFVGEERFSFGYTGRRDTASAVVMNFRTPHLEYLGRWLLGFTDGVRIARGDALRTVVRALLSDLERHWR